MYVTMNNLKMSPLRCGRFIIRNKKRNSANVNDGLVKLRGMPRDAVSEINSPRQRCRRPVRVIRQPAKKTSDAPDRKSQRNRCGEQISGRRSFANSPLYPFDGKQSADQSSHDRLPGHQIDGIVPMRGC